MLKGISPVISPQLLKILAEMGHGDKLCIGDSNFPATSNSKNGNVVRLDGVGATQMLDAVLSLITLDDFVDSPVMIMNKEPRHADLACPIWDEFKEIVAKYDERGKDCCKMISRADFYKETRDCYAIVSTTETSAYGCIILQKGCI